MRLFTRLTGILLLLVNVTATADVTATASSLDDLLQKVKLQQQQNQHQNGARNEDFSKDLQYWQDKLTSAQEQLNQAQRQASEQGLRFDESEKALASLEAELDLSKDNLGELFAVVSQISGEFAAAMQGSLIAAQYPQHAVFVNSLVKRKALPTLHELEQLWFIMQEEMIASGKITTFNAEVLDASGVSSEKSITRVGAFNLISDKQYLLMDPASHLAQPLPRPVASNVQRTLNNWVDENAQVKPFYFDPAKGELLTVLSRTPSWSERIRQGDIIGYLIIAILVFGLLVAAVRFTALAKESLRIKQQLKQTTANPNNALGRIFALYQSNKNQTTQVLELKLEEAILREVPRLERGSSVLKILAAIAPMMGLLGTVTGMIGTFQSITLFGTGDPKLMAGGISMALITTVMGLIAALPLLLIHSLLHSRASSLINIIELQSAGLIAQQAEANEQA